MTTQTSSNNESGGKWITYLSNLIAAAYEHTAVAIGTNIYIMGGKNSGGTIQNINWLYNTLLDTYTTKTVITAAKTQHSAASDGTNIFVISGANSGTTPIDTVYRYNVASNDWATMTAITAAVRYSSAVYVAKQGLIYVTGGITDTGTTRSNKCYAYNVIANSWTAKTDLPQTLYAHGSCDSPDGLSFYVFGGFDTNSRTTVYKYNIVGDSWSTLTSMPVALSYINAVRIGNYVYICGGYTTTSTAICLRYDINNDSWTWITENPNNIYSYASTGVANNYIHTFGGYISAATALVSSYRL